MSLQIKTLTTGDYAWKSWSNGYVIGLTLTEEAVDVAANTSLVSYLFTISNTNNNRFTGWGNNWDISIADQQIPIRNFYFDSPSLKRLLPLRTSRLSTWAEASANDTAKRHTDSNMYKTLFIKLPLKQMIF